MLAPHQNIRNAGVLNTNFRNKSSLLYLQRQCRDYHNNLSCTYKSSICGIPSRLHSILKLNTSQKHLVEVHWLWPSFTVTARVPGKTFTVFFKATTTCFTAVCASWDVFHFDSKFHINGSFIVVPQRISNLLIHRHVALNIVYVGTYRNFLFNRWTFIFLKKCYFSRWVNAEWFVINFSHVLLVFGKISQSIWSNLLWCSSEVCLRE